MRITIPLLALSGASPLRESQMPQNRDDKHLEYLIKRIPEIRQGLVGVVTEYDYLETGDEEESCRIDLKTKDARAVIVAKVEKKDGWYYSADIHFSDGEPQHFEGKGAHDSKPALIRKIRGLIRVMLEI